MLTARVHLDDVTDENGPLRVIPGSHRYGTTMDGRAAQPVTLHCRAGDVLLMRPLLTHASGHADADDGAAPADRAPGVRRRRASCPTGTSGE